MEAREGEEREHRTDGKGDRVDGRQEIGREQNREGKGTKKKGNVEKMKEG